MIGYSERESEVIKGRPEQEKKKKKIHTKKKKKKKSDTAKRQAIPESGKTSSTTQGNDTKELK